MNNKGAKTRSKKKVENTYRIHVGELKFHHQSAEVEGTQVISVTHRVAACPVGLIWFRHVMVNQVEILHVYTHHYFRRNGVASALIRRLRMLFPKEIICTATANEKSKPLLLKLGFFKTENGWLSNPERLTDK